MIVGAPTGRSTQYQSKSFIMMDSRCLRHFQYSWQILQIFKAKLTDFIYVL